MIRIAQLAEKENRLMNAAIYHRSAELYTLYQDPDKELLYDKFIALFYQAFSDENIQQFEIPYEDGAESQNEVGNRQHYADYQIKNSV